MSRESPIVKLPLSACSAKCFAAIWTEPRGVISCEGAGPSLSVTDRFAAGGLYRINGTCASINRRQCGRKGSSTLEFPWNRVDALLLCLLAEVAQRRRRTRPAAPLSFFAMEIVPLIHNDELLLHVELIDVSDEISCGVSSSKNISHARRFSSLIETSKMLWRK